MWNMVRELRNNGVTIILTTHYIEEAQEMADRIGVINKGEIILVEDKKTLMRKLGKKQLTLNLSTPLAAIPADLRDERLDLSADGKNLVYTFDSVSQKSAITEIMKKISDHGIDFNDLHTKESSLEDIFVSLVENKT